LPVLERFPDAGNKVIARKLHKDFPDLWLTVEHARSWVRDKRGANGDRKRSVKANEEFRQPIRSPGDPFGKLPESLAKLEDSSPYVLECTRALILADVHMPYHDECALETALEHGYKIGVDAIVLLGDLLDFYASSRWVTDPRKRDLPGEIGSGREFVQQLRDAWPGAEIIYKAGNHEERWERYLFCRAPDLVGIDDFEIDKVLRLEQQGIRWLDRMRHIKIHRLNLVHGHEFGDSIYSPVNAARGLFLRSKAISMCGHFHQTSTHSEMTMEDASITTWSVGCLADLHPQYRRYSTRWNHGFAVVHGGEDWRVENFKIIKGKVY